MDITTDFPAILKPPLQQLVRTLPVSDFQLTLDTEDILEYTNDRYQITFRGTDALITVDIEDTWASLSVLDLLINEDVDVTDIATAWKARFHLATPDSLEQLHNFLQGTIEQQEDRNAS